MTSGEISSDVSSARRTVGAGSTRNLAERNIGDQRGGRIPSLTGIRGAAAILVFVFHLSTTTIFRDKSISTGMHSVVEWAGYMALSLFFVLSGFVMAWTAGPNDTKAKFWRRRAAKVLPNHLVAWTLAIGLMVATGLRIMPFSLLPGLDGERLLSSLSSLFLVQAWIPDVSFYVSGDPVSWSLSCEAFFYLLFPFLALGVRRVRAERLALWVAGVVAMMVCVPFAASTLLTGGPTLAWDPGLQEWQNYAVHFFPASRLLEFLLGILMARLVLSGRWRLGPLPSGIVLLAANLLALELPFLYRLPVTALPVAMFIASLAIHDLRREGQGRPPGPLARRPMVWLGETSFAFYLLHMPVMTYGHALLGADTSWSTPVAIVVVLSFYGVALLLAWLMYTLVEVPATRRFSTRRRIRPDSVAALGKL